MALETPETHASEEFLLAYGDALVQWANLEVILALWFQKIAFIPDQKTARAIFFSARSFQGRSDMFMAALDGLNVVPDDIAFLKEGILKAIAYNSTRNRLAHGWIRPGEEGPTSIAPGKTWTEPGDITLTELRNAARNFAGLRRALMNCFEDSYPLEGEEPAGEPLAVCHEQLRQLPNEACSSELSQKQRGRLLQRQQRAGKKHKTRQRPPRSSGE